MGGVPKGLMHQDGVTVLERLCGLCQDGPIFLVGDPQGPYANLGYPIHGDMINERGAPGGVLTALQLARSDWVRILACDLPAMNQATIDALRPRDECDVVLYRVAERPQYLVSLWHKNCVPTLKRLLSTHAPGFTSVLSALSVAWLEVSDTMTFHNMNTPEDARSAGFKTIR